MDNLNVKMETTNLTMGVIERELLQQQQDLMHIMQRTKVKSERSKSNLFEKNQNPVSTTNLTIDNFGKNTSVALTAGGATPESSQEFSHLNTFTCLKPTSIPMDSQTTMYQVGPDGMLLQNEDDNRNGSTLYNNQAWQSPEKTQYAEWVTNQLPDSS